MRYHSPEVDARRRLSRARAAAVPTHALNLATRGGRKEFNRRMREVERSTRHGYQTAYPAVGIRGNRKPRKQGLGNSLGKRPRRKWKQHNPK